MGRERTLTDDLADFTDFDGIVGVVDNPQIDAPDRPSRRIRLGIHIAGL